MTDTIEQKALALVNEVRTEYPLVSSEVASNRALYRAVERYETDLADLQDEYDEVCKLHEAFRQEVSDAVENAIHVNGMADWHRLRSFIIAKPDPLVDVVKSTIKKTVRVPGPAHCSGPAEYFTYNWDECAAAVCEAIRLGYEIREKAGE